MIDNAITNLKSARLLGTFESGSTEWHDLRRGAVGGSQVGAILGVNPWESPYTAWAKACGLISDDFEPSMPMKLGSAFEAPIRQIFAAENPHLRVYETGTWASLGAEWQHANPDGIIEHGDGELEVLEIKFSRLPWFNGVPLHYKYQVLWYMHVTGIRLGRIVAVAGGELQEFAIAWDQFEVESMVQAVTAWRIAVVTETAPDWDGSKSTYETVRAISPEITELQSFELGQLWELLSVAQDAYDLAERELNKCKSAVIAEAQGAKYGLYEGTQVLSLNTRNGGLPYITYKKGK